MKVRELQAGDVVVIDERGEHVLVRIGALLGPTLKRGVKDVRNVLVHSLDVDTWREQPTRGVEPDVEVVAIIDTLADRLARRRRRDERPLVDAAGERDPLLGRKRDEQW